MIKAELINDNLEVIMKLARNGIIKKEIINDFIIYDKFQNMSEDKMIRYEKLAKYYNMTSQTIRKKINKLQKFSI